MRIFWKHCFFTPKRKAGRIWQKKYNRQDPTRELGISKPYAYKLVREMNEELKKKGFLTIPGRVSRRYFEEKFYGLRDRQ